MVSKKQWLLVSQITHAMPLGYRFEDTGAPRGERNMFFIRRMRDESVVFENFSLQKILEHIRTLKPDL